MIEIISEVEAIKVIDTRKPIGLFLILNKDDYTGIDNLTGDAWTEDFRNLKNCLMFLNGLDLGDCLENKVQYELDGDKLYDPKTGETLNDIDEITQNQLEEILDIKNTLCKG